MYARLLSCAAAALSAPALAVGLGPLSKSGVTDGPAKAFYLDLRNPYDHSETFQSLAFEHDGETPAANVAIFPSTTTLAANGGRRLLVIARNLRPGESYTFRVCASRPPKPNETVYARVCSKLTARRILARG